LKDGLNISAHLGKAREVAPVDGIQHFVGLFDQILAKRIQALLAIPGTSIRSSQARHDFHQAVEFVAWGNTWG
jgi:hypothetical protein